MPTSTTPSELLELVRELDELQYGLRKDRASSSAGFSARRRRCPGRGHAADVSTSPCRPSVSTRNSPKGGDGRDRPELSRRGVGPGEKAAAVAPGQDKSGPGRDEGGPNRAALVGMFSVMRAVGRSAFRLRRGLCVPRRGRWCLQCCGWATSLLLRRLLRPRRPAPAAVPAATSRRRCGHPPGPGSPAR